MQFDWGLLVLAIVVLVVLIAIAWWILSRLYERSSTETSFVRTGFGGRKVVISGGALVIPVLHQVVRIGMNTARLAVACEKEQSLITRDRIRVDVTADFYVRVEPDAESVAAAAQTLGKRTTSPPALAGSGGRQVHRRAARSGCGNDAGRAARVAPRLFGSGSEDGVPGAAVERTRHRDGVHRSPRPDQPRVFQSEQRLRRGGIDLADPGDRGAPQEAQ